MLTLKEWMELVDYKITEGSDYQWQCFGHNVYSLTSWNQDHEGYSFNITFDTKTQEVFCVEVCDYKHERAYRIINSDYRTAYDKEAKSHGIDGKEAWDNCSFVDLEEDDDFIQKSLAIKSGKNYDTRVSIPVEFTDEELFQYMKLAHERDITLNQLVEEALRMAIDEYKLRDQIDDMREEYDFSSGHKGAVIKNEN